MTIDAYSPVPLYQQLAAIIRGWIKDGKLARLEKLPSELSLEQEFEVSRDTVRKAIALLRDEGLVFTLPQRGTLVGPPP